MSRAHKLHSEGAGRLHGMMLISSICSGRVLGSGVGAVDKQLAGGDRKSHVVGGLLIHSGGHRGAPR